MASTITLDGNVPLGAMCLKSNLVLDLSPAPHRTMRNMMLMIPEICQKIARHL